LERDDARLEEFLTALPLDREHVIEFRHASWFKDDVLARLREHGVGFCIEDMRYARSPLAVTAGFAYIRFHGTSARYSGSYTERQLAEWAKKIADLAAGVKTVYIYFNNDVQGHAVENARTLRRMLGATAGSS
jgi:uncharacterized protein YecE (DUF72 family)